MNASPFETSLAPLAAMAAAIGHDDIAATRRLAAHCAASAPRMIAALRIHASTTRYGLTKALADAVPSLVARLPAEAFETLARDFAAEWPPRRAALTDWGDGFAAFLRRRRLPDECVALVQLDQAWMAALFAADAAPLTAAALGAVAPDAMPRLRLVAHPALRLVELDGPHADAWMRAAALPDIDAVIEDGADGRWVALIRPEARVRARVLAAPAAVFLGGLLRGDKLSEAFAAALVVDPTFDLQASLGALLADGAFAEFVTGEADES